MKKILLLTLLLWPFTAHSQAFVNPDTTQQQGDIYLQNTDVYYAPFAPPSSMDTRANLCAISDFLRDPNGIGDYWRGYLPMVYNTATSTYVLLSNWSPSGPGRAIGQNTPWQRFFTAKRDASGNPHNIIAGDSVTPGLHHPVGHGPVIISANEDVDFRASGRVILKSGFHVKPGAFFHAYTEPKWDTTVFNDEFADTATYRNNWRIAHNWNDINTGAECSMDSNAYLDTDYQAEDGHALDIILREASNDTCSCDSMEYGVWKTDTCGYAVHNDTVPNKFAFSSAMPMSCPWPYTTLSGVMGPSAYAHAPYGKYEFRDKIPHTLHHTNNWGANSDNEFDLNETDNAAMGRVNPNFSHHQRYGPFMGIFQIVGSDTDFICPSAAWGRHNFPSAIIIQNFLYHVQQTSPTSDTVQAVPNQWPPHFPASIVDTHDSIPFYYETWNPHKADNVTWTVDTDNFGKWRIFSAAWDTSGGVPQLFTKGYQPVTLTLKDNFFSPPSSYSCHWVDSLNEPNHGIIYMDDTMAPTDIHSFTEAYQYQTVDLYTGKWRYPVPTVIIDHDTALFDNPGVTDSSAYASTPYRYHTFTMEWLPHEIRYLIDSNVVYRFPDRLVPRGNPYYDWATTQSRSPTELYPAQVDIDGASTDPMGTDTGHSPAGNDSSISYMMRHYFETHTTNPGFWDVTIGGVTYHAAHHLIDYVKVWDVPKDVQIPDYPH